MKKYFNFSVLVMLMLAMCVSFSSCSDDDEDDVSIVGKWELVEASYSTASKTLTFNSDKTGLDGGDPMTWSMTNNALTVALNENHIPLTVTVVSLTDSELKIQWLTYSAKYKKIK